MKQTLFILSILLATAAAMNTATTDTTLKPGKPTSNKFSDADFDCQRFRHSSNRKK